MRRFSLSLPRQVSTMMRRLGVSMTSAWMLILSRPRSSAKSGWSQSIGRIASGLACGRMNRLPPVTSSSTILVTVTSPIRHFIGAAAGLLHLQELDVEDQGGIGWNRTGSTARAIAELGRDRQSALAADLHAGHTFVPAGNDLLGTERELEGLAAIDGAVELLALGAVVRQPAGVVHGDFVAGSRGSAVSGL